MFHIKCFHNFVVLFFCDQSSFVPPPNTMRRIRDRTDLFYTPPTEDGLRSCLNRLRKLRQESDKQAESFYDTNWLVNKIEFVDLNALTRTHLNKTTTILRFSPGEAIFRPYGGKSVLNSDYEFPSFDLLWARVKRAISSSKPPSSSSSSSSDSVTALREDDINGLTSSACPSASEIIIGDPFNTIAAPISPSKIIIESTRSNSKNEVREPTTQPKRSKRQHDTTDGIET